jgi:hypothetical protein
MAYPAEVYAAEILLFSLMPKVKKFNKYLFFIKKKFTPNFVSFGAYYKKIQK